MKILIITGGIGSGKSTVCRILHSRFGFPHYDSDARVKSLYSEHPSLLSAIENALGETFRDESGTFSPSTLARRIFSDKDALSAVEALVFPVLIEDFRTFMESASGSIVVFESATILEKKQFEGFGDFTVLVDAPYDVRLARAMKRDSMPQEEIRKRMDNQVLMNSLSAGGVDKRIDFILDNSSSEEDLIVHIENLMGKLT
jgi:dephospho-CoA kinase